MTTKKNVLLITADQWSGDYLGCARNKEILTPSLDELARYGIRYSNAVSTTPVCIPARRELMLGCTSKKHGDRIFNETLPMPQDIPSLAQTFRDNGYQAYAVGKLHVFPQRDRIGFDDVILYEEGRHKKGMSQDDYERFLAHNGHAGEEFSHSMCNNNYSFRPFNMDEKFHPTNWITREMCETIIRRDPNKPTFWYLSYGIYLMRPPIHHWFPQRTIWTCTMMSSLSFLRLENGPRSQNRNCRLVTRIIALSTNTTPRRNDSLQMQRRRTMPLAPTLTISFAW